MAYEDKPETRASPLIPKPIIKINNFVRKHTQAVDVETLNQQGVTKVNFLTYSKINELISLAVQKAFAKYQRSWSQAEAQVIQEQAKAELDQELTRQAEAVERIKDREKTLEEEVEELRPMVESRIEELAARGESSLEPEIETSAEESLRQLEQKVRSVVASFLEEERRKPSARPDLKKFARVLELAIGIVMEAERNRLLSVLDRVSFQKTELLTRRLEKLKGHLKELEEAHRQLVEEKWIDPGIPSIYREIQGLSLEDSHFEKKRDMLKIIFEENLQLQKAVGNE